MTRTLLVLLAACTSSEPHPDVDALPRVDGEHQTSGVTPSNELGGLESTGLEVSPPAGTFDTDAACVTPSALGNCAPVADICVCRMDTLAVGQLTITGSRALAILAYDSVVIAGDLVVEPGAGSRGSVVTAAENLVGGAGGTHGTLGGGGTQPVGTPELVPLVGGAPGQDACGARGGTGGGALQITAGKAISVTGTISAGGGGGRGGGSGGLCLGGAGGGAGGALLFEAPTVNLTGTIAANGGGGGGGGSNGYASGGSGARGGLAGGAAGGAGESNHGCALNGYTVGGDGGTGSRTAGGGLGEASDVISGCLGGTIYLGAGGGGGGGGRIRVNAAHGCNCGGVFSPAPTFGVVSER